MLHERFDLTHWKQVFPLARLRKEAEGKPANLQPSANIITGPYNLAVLEQLREASFATLPNEKRVPTDVFVWALGEPTRRDITKIGGLPYWEKGLPWPTTSSGTPMTFVAQICFADSRDLTPPLPGDILLLFIEGVDGTGGWEAEPQYTFLWNMEDEDSEVHIVWASLHDRPLITVEDIPATNWQLMPFSGIIHRTWDYPQANGFAYPEIARHIPTVFEATKIGGICPWPDSWSLSPLGETDHYLCSVSSLSFASGNFPFLNVPTDKAPALQTLRRSKMDGLMIGDMGLINFFLAPDGTVSWSVHD
jgi:hypothetical protein